MKMTTEEAKQLCVDVTTEINRKLFEPNSKVLQIMIDDFIECNNEVSSAKYYEIVCKKINFSLSQDKRNSSMVSSGTVHESLLEEFDTIVEFLYEEFKQASFLTQCLLAISLTVEDDPQFYRNCLPESIFTVLDPNSKFMSLTVEDEDKLYLTREEKVFVHIRNSLDKIDTYIGQTLLNI